LPPVRPFGLPRIERVRRRSEYLAVQLAGKKIQSDSFLIFLLAHPEREELPARLGVTVSKKVGNAVERNRVKRLVREAFRRHKRRFPSGIEVVFIAKRTAVERSYVEIERELERLCRRWSQKR
jgi:ribonuclease P protein component